MLSPWLDDTMTALIPLAAGLDNVIYWKIDVVSSHARRLEGSADDGKRFQAMDVVSGLLLGENLLKWGGGLEEGGPKNSTGSEVGG